jgi:lysophospholipase L1-like esterase
MSIPKTSSGKGAGRKVAFALVPLVVVFGAAELGLRAAGWPSVAGGFIHNDVFWTADKDETDKKYPHNEENRFFTATTDEHALRAPNYSIDKRPGTYRIMTLGCSTTFGWGVNDKETYPAVLGHLIAGTGRTQTEVINGGQPGYTTFQGLRFWDETLRHFEPDVVLIGYVVQDARKAAYTDKAQAILQQDSKFLKENLLYRSRVYLFVKDLLGSVQIRTKEREEGGESGDYRVPPQDYADNLRAFVARIRDVGGTPVLFGYPLERSGYTSEHRAILQAAAENLDVLHFDPQKQMAVASNSAELYWPQDKGHATSAGNKQIADWVFEFLKENDLLGPGGAS